MPDADAAPEVPLLATKLHPPRRRSGTVPRPRLIERLDARPDARLVLVTAPPGFGKTTAVAEWLDAQHPASTVAWVSLDDRDDVPRTFWRYVLAALAATTALPRAGAAIARTDTPIEDVLTVLCNEIAAAPRPTVLVLDDFHVVDERSILAGIAFLIDSAPPNLRVVIASRSDPALPLARLRVAGDLVELRAADLRFDRDEAAAYLDAETGTALTDADAGALWQRTEGWIAAIQLAAISLRGRDDPTAFVAAFAGDDRYVVDYLVEEVLRGQPEDLRTVLLETSILSRFTADLVQAVTGIADGGAVLARLDRANLFLVPLDDQRRWYRYHHLFGQMLRARLGVEQPEHLSELHTRASDWFAHAGFADDAIAHALEAGLTDRAAALVLAETPILKRRRDEAVLLRWLEQLPAQTVRADAALSLELAGARLAAGRTDGVDELLAIAAAGAPADEVRRIEGGVALYRAARALTERDLARVESHARRAAASAVDDDLLRGSATGLLALAEWNRGDLAAATTSWTSAIADLRRAGHDADARGGAIALTDLLVAQGRLGEASTVAHDEGRAALATDPPGRGAADMLVALTSVHLERHEPDAARRRLDEASALGPGNGLPQNAHRLLVARARLHAAEHDLDAALERWDAAEAAFTADFFPDHHPIAAQRARALVLAGRVRDAADWARGRGLTADAADLDYLHEYEHLVLARIQLAEADAARATGAADAPDAVAHTTQLLERIRADADTGGRTGTAIEVRILLARAALLAGRSDDALTALREAVDAAEPGGFVQVFADEGATLARPLSALAKRQPGRAFLRLLADAVTTAPSAAGGDALASPLSDRERDVLRLLRSDLGGPEIARHLSVSLNTVRSHTKSIYAKLGVTSRRAAVTRATELGLLAP
ncbi:hypothetical protein GCM10022200_14090 [Microbacterium awajiense]|uniref:HTH luxR-type domain-containing protein n=1 Tax=Microbacterium awajiense TaxID=415214 RepID=A0ABP7AHC2_9MICO